MASKELSHSLDTLLRPGEWGEYVGQEVVKKNLQTLIQAACERKQVPEHILLYGSAGLGKTTLAHIIGAELKLPVQVTSGVVVERSGDIVSLLSTMELGGVLFIDEIHRMSRVCEETLYPIMESGGLDIVVGKGPTARSVHIDLPPTTIIGATTQIGKISAPLRSRFSGGVLRLSNYNTEELAEIITRSAKLLEVAISPKAAAAIAERSRSTPRIANYLLKRVRDYAQIKNIQIDPDVVEEALQERSIDAYGLTEEDRMLLTTIRDTFSGGPVGIKTLATVMNEDVSAIEEVYEPFLLQTGFLERKPHGRCITNKGIEYLSGVGL